MGLSFVHLNVTKQFKLNNLNSIYTTKHLALVKGTQLALKINGT